MRSPQAALCNPETLIDLKPEHHKLTTFNNKLQKPESRNFITFQQATAAAKEEPVTMDQLITQLLTYSKGIWKYRWFAIAAAWTTLLLGGAVIFFLPNRYEASARVFVDTQNILKPLLSQMTSVPNIEQQVMIMSRTLLSRPNVERVMRMVDMDIKTETQKEHEQALEKLIKDIKVTATGRDDIYTISYSNDNSRLAKDVVQSLLTVFVEGSIGDKKQDSSKAIHFLDEQIKSYEEKLIAAENALKDFKQKNAELLPRQGSIYESKLAETIEILNQAKLDLIEAEQGRDAIRRQLAGEDLSLLSPPEQSTVGDPELEARLQSLKKNLDMLELQFTQRHPDIISTKRLIAQLEERKAQEAKQRVQARDPAVRYGPMLQQMSVALSDAESSVASLRARVKEYSARVARLQSMSQAVPEMERQLSQLNRDYQINKDNYEKLVGRREAAKLAGELNATSDLIKFRVVDPPTVPQTPVSPNRPRLFGLVFLLSLAVGAGIALLISQVFPTFLTQHSLRQAVTFPVLGAVSRNWTELETKRRSKSRYAFICSVALLFVVFCAGMAAMALDLKASKLVNMSIASLR